MKKLVFAVVAMFAMTFASCGNGQTSKATSSNDTDSVAVDSVDSVSVDSSALSKSERYAMILASADRV